MTYGRLQGLPFFICDKLVTSFLSVLGQNGCGSYHSDQITNEENYMFEDGDIEFFCSIVCRNDALTELVSIGVEIVLAHLAGLAFVRSFQAAIASVSFFDILSS